jgi:threonyl-tRNA synthetase
VIHRAPLSTHERFIAFLTEHYAGDFPLWLSPVQVMVLAVSDKYENYAREVFNHLKNRGIRVELASSSETLGKRIREAELEKIPYVLVVGEKEKATETVSIRKRHKDTMLVEPLDKFIEKLLQEIKDKI